MNKDRTVTIYFRDKDGIYIIPYGATTQGFQYQTEPFAYLPIDSSPLLVWEAAKGSLENTNRVVPHPEKWDEVTAWYRKAGVRDWKAFAVKSEAISISD